MPVTPVVVPGRIGDNPPTSTLYYGLDVREALKLLPDQSIQVIATSPPYFGLRDYGTGSWEGGDPDCDHGVERWEETKQTQGAQSGHASEQDRLARKQCFKCGARRLDTQIGLEETPDEYVKALVEVFREARRVLRDDGIFWLNLGDSYAGSGAVAGGEWKQSNTGSGGTWSGGVASTQRRHHPPAGLKPKDLIGIPWMVAFALQADGWYLRQDIVWSKPNPMPESVRDRCTKAHEYIFMLTKQPRYFFDADAVKEPLNETTVADFVRQGGARGTRVRNVGGRTDGYTRSKGSVGNLSGRNKRSVWAVPPKPYRGAHFACWPEALVEPMVKAGCSEKGHCPKCGARWKRVIGQREDIQAKEKTLDGHVRVRPGAARRGDQHHRGVAEKDPTGKGGSTLARKRIPTGGWEPGCDCGLDPIRDVVLDIFSGSATTGVVANRLGHDYIGIDLNAEYLPLAERRLKGISESTSSKDEEEPEEDMTIAGMFGPEKG